MLHPQARAAVKAKLVQGLSLVRVKNGKYLDGFSAFLSAYQADAVLPQAGNLHNQLVTYVGERPFANFVTDILRQRLRDECDFEGDAEPRDLFETGVFGTADELAEWLITQFETLPWTYSIAIDLPTDAVSIDVMHESSHPIGNECRIAKTDLFLASEFPLTHPNERRNAALKAGGLLALLVDQPKWKDDRFYFLQEREGFVGIYGTGSVIEDCQFTLQAFLGLGLALRLLRYDRQFDNEHGKFEWKVHQNIDGEWEYLARFDLEADTSDVLKDIGTFAFSDSYPEENRIPWLNQVIRKISEVFSAENSSTIQLAAKWFFDSYKGRDATLRYIRLMTSIEILLGENADKSKASLGEILGNRLAYLIGKNHTERGEILKKFKRIYGVRSGILHHGKHKLSEQERELISQLEGYCKRAIEAEVDSLLG